MHACPHTALLPLQVSDVHESPSSVQVVPTAWKTSTHALLVPVQWSRALLSHAPLCEAPVQMVDADANTFAGHAPRSEERRVGKECRSRWGRCREKRRASACSREA